MEDSSASTKRELTQRHGNTSHLVQSVEKGGNFGEGYHDGKVQSQDNTFYIYDGPVSRNVLG